MTIEKRTMAAKKKASKKKATKKAAALTIQPDLKKEQANKQRKAKLLMNKLQEQYPRAHVGYANDESMKRFVEYERVGTPFPELDRLSGGGLPKGKFTTVFGNPGAGKTTLIMQIIAHWMQNNEIGDWIWVDTENSFDKSYAEHIGIDLTRLVLLPGTAIMEDLVQMLLDLGETGAFVGYVVDSLGGFVTSQEIQSKPAKIGQDGVAKTVHADTVAALPKVLSKFLGIANLKLGGLENPMVQILIGHVYQDINPTGRTSYQQKGGTALKHFAHLRLFLRRQYDKDRKGDIVMPDGQKKKVMLGYNGIIKIDKTKQSATEGHEIALPFQFGLGFDTDAAAINSAMALGVILQGGAYYKYKGFPEDSKGQNRIKGKDNAKKFIVENPEVLEMIRDDIRNLTEFQEVGGVQDGFDPESETSEETTPF